MPHSETRHSLIVRLKGEQDELAWQAFVLQYESFLQRLAARQGVPERHVADVVQQILLTIAKSIDGWKDDGQQASFRRWLATVARNVVIKFMTRERKQAGGEGGTDTLELLNNVPAEPDAQQIKNYEHELISWAAEQVKQEFLPSSWAAFQATVIDKRPVAEVAAEMGVTPGSIYMSRSRIVARIKRKVDVVLNE